LNFNLPQKKVLRLLIYRIFESGSGVLRELGAIDGKIPKTVAQKFSRVLGKIFLTEKIENFADRRILTFLSKNVVIAYDLTDISKKFSRKIEKISSIFDGSRREKSRGFFLHGVGVGNLLWRLKIHDSTRHFLPQIRRKILKKLIKITKKFDPIFVFDRGNDDRKLFEFLTEKSANFIVRLKKNRTVILAKTGEKICVENLELGRHEILLPSKETAQKKVKKYLKFGVLVRKNGKFKTPIRLIFS
jgi:hypothetical protein